MNWGYRAILIAIGLFAREAAPQAPTWTTYTKFPVFHDTLSVRWPSIAFVADTMVIAANFFPRDTVGFSPKNRASVVRSPGGPMRLPEGPFSFVHPQIASDSHGTLHMVWAEARDSSLFAWVAMPVSLWHASYREGKWSPPRQLLAGSVLTWSSDARAIVCDSSGRLHVVLPAALPDRFAIVYFRIGPSGDVEDEVKWPGGSYAAITSLGNDSLIVSYATADSQTPRGGAAVFTRESGDGGHTWDPPVLVTRSVKRNMGPPVVERSGTALHLLWIEASRFGDEQSQMRAFTSPSAHAAWMEVPGRITIAGLPIRLVSAGSRCGDYVVVVEIVDHLTTEPRMHLAAFRVRGDRLFEARVFPQLETTANVGLAAFGDSLHIVFSVPKPGGDSMITATASSRACATM